jgi:hypothetical protein
MSKTKLTINHAMFYKIEGDFETTVKGKHTVRRKNGRSLPLLIVCKINLLYWFPPYWF